MNLQFQELNSKGSVIFVKQDNEPICELKEVDKKELKQLRKKRASSLLILKRDERYFVSTEPDSTMQETLSHLPTICWKCSRYSGASDAYGGCSRVRKRICNIEDFPFIEIAFEFKSLLYVLSCQNYTNEKIKFDKSTPKLDLSEIYEILVKGSDLVLKNGSGTFFPLEKTATDDLKQLRANSSPTFLLKTGERLFKTNISGRITLIGSLVADCQKHLCSECRCCNAASDENGGCAKVRGFAQRIERYPFIELGYETFNSARADCFVVLKCKNYKKARPARPIGSKDIVRARLSLAEHYFEGTSVDTMQKRRMLIAKNKSHRYTHR